MARVEKTVFISYRRTNIPWALAVYHHLTHHGFDVFFDYLGIASGNFEQVILDNIRARAHFLVLLTPSALERCGDPSDWFRREIEEAIDCRRNIVPMMLESFNFGAPGIGAQLAGKMALLKRYNGLGVPSEYFDAAMAKLRERFLNVALDAVAHPVSEVAQSAARVQQMAATAAPPVPPRELTAQDWFERGYRTAEADEKLQCYDEAIRLKPDYADAYYNRGFARNDKGDLVGALKDYDEAIRLKPDYADAYINRGIARKDKGDLAGALKDYDEAIRLKPDYVDAYINRGIARKDKGDLAGALKDYDEAIRLKPDYADAYINRGFARNDKGDLVGALKDYDEAIRLKPDYALAYYNRGIARRAGGDLAGAETDFAEAHRLRAERS
jgi:tetratricopeptide (TPR) repeat protein